VAAVAYPPSHEPKRAIQTLQIGPSTLRALFVIDEWETPAPPHLTCTLLDAEGQILSEGDGSPILVKEPLKKRYGIQFLTCELHQRASPALATRVAFALDEEPERRWIADAKPDAYRTNVVGNAPPDEPELVVAMHQMDPHSSLCPILQKSLRYYQEKHGVAFFFLYRTLPTGPCDNLVSGFPIQWVQIPLLNQYDMMGDGQLLMLQDVWLRALRARTKWLVALEWDDFFVFSDKRTTLLQYLNEQSESLHTKTFLFTVQVTPVEDVGSLDSINLAYDVGTCATQKVRDASCPNQWNKRSKFAVNLQQEYPHLNLQRFVNSRVDRVAPLRDGVVRKFPGLLTPLLAHTDPLAHLFDSVPLRIAPPRRPTRVAVIVPITQRDVMNAYDTLKRTWTKFGSPCRSPDTTLIDYIFLWNMGIGPEANAAPTFPGCFLPPRHITANLTMAEDGYPGGPSNMFYNVFRDRIAMGLKDVTHMMWMEWDVMPIKPYWVDALIREASREDPFWVRGSRYMGDTLDYVGFDPASKTWLAHINGNALYSLEDQHFHQFLRICRSLEPPSGEWKAFDVAIWRCLRAFPLMWGVYQRFHGMLQSTQMIEHWGFWPASLANSIANPNTFFVHGSVKSTGSKGNLRTDRGMMTRSLKPVDIIAFSDGVTALILCERLSTCMSTVESVMGHVPHAFEWIVVFVSGVTGEDVLRERFPSLMIHVSDHDHLLAAALQAVSWVRGNYVWFVWPNAIIPRQVLRRHFFWDGKPILAYRALNSEMPIVLSTRMHEAHDTLGRLLGFHIDYYYGCTDLLVLPRVVAHDAQQRLAHVTDWFDIPMSVHPQLAFGAVAHAAWAPRMALASMDAPDRWNPETFPPPIVVPVTCPKSRANLPYPMDPRYNGFYGETGSC